MFDVREAFGSMWIIVGLIVTPAGASATSQHINRLWTWEAIRWFSIPYRVRYTWTPSYGGSSSKLEISFRDSMSTIKSTTSLTLGPPLKSVVAAANIAFWFNESSFLPEGKLGIEGKSVMSISDSSPSDTCL